MHEGKPLLTVVKSRSIDDAEPPLEPQDESLLQTLSMLCSFHTAEDLDNPKIAQQLEWHQQIHWIKDVVFTIPEGNEDGTDRIITWNGEEAVN